MFKRKERYGVLVSLTDHCIQLARLQLDERPLVVDAFHETATNDEEGITRWLRESFPEHTSGYLPGYCTFYPADRLFIREALNTRRLAEPAYVAGLVAEHAKIPSAKEWQIAALHAAEGLPLTPDSTQRAALLIGVPWASVRDAQQRLRKWGIRPRRLELGTLALLGGINRHLALNAYPDAIAVCEIAHSYTRIYLLGKDGVHTPPPLPHGLLSIEEAAMKELAAPDVATALRQLEAQPESLRAHSRRLVRMLSRHLRPAIDYFEMQTGQRIGGLFCAHLPYRLAWLEEALATAVDLDFFKPDFATWLPAVGLKTSDGSAPSPAWFQPMSVIAQLASSAPAPAPAAPVHEQKT